MITVCASLPPAWIVQGLNQLKPAEVLRIVSGSEWTLNVSHHPQSPPPQPGLGTLPRVNNTPTSTGLLEEFLAGTNVCTGEDALRAAQHLEPLPLSFDRPASLWGSHTVPTQLPIHTRNLFLFTNTLAYL